MGIDFLAGFLFAVIGLGFLLTLVPVYNITNADWYHTGHDFFQHWVLDTGLQFSAFLPIKAVGTVGHIFISYFFIPLLAFNIARLILNTISGGGTRG